MLSQDKTYIQAPEHKMYPKLSVKLYGKGVVLDTFVDGSSLKMKRHQIARSGQVILSEIWGKKGAIGFVPPEGDGALCTSHFFLFDVLDSKLDPRYLQAIFTANYLSDQLGAEAKGTTGYAAVRPKHLLAAHIPLPPLPEQRRIVARIEELAARIEEARVLRRQAVEEAEALVDAELDNVFAAISKRAEALVVGNEGGFVTSGPRGWGKYYDEGGSRRLIRVENVWNRELDLSTAARVALPARAGDIERSEVKAGDVLVTITGAIGRVGVVRKFDLPCHVSQHVALVRPPKSVDSDYLYWFLQSPSFGRSQTEGEIYGATKPGINLTSLRKLRLPVLPFSEQKGLAAYFSDLQTEVDSLKRLQAETAAELDALLPSVLDRAFKGKL